MAGLWRGRGAVSRPVPSSACAGTSPLDPKSVPQIANIRREGDATVSDFQAGAGKRDRLEASDTLNDDFPFKLAPIPPLRASSCGSRQLSRCTLRTVMAVRTDWAMKHCSCAWWCKASSSAGVGVFAPV